MDGKVSSFFLLHSSGAYVEFYFFKGIFALAIDKNNRPDRSLYFHALAAQTENSVPLDVLNDRAAWESNRNSYAQAFKVLGARGTQSAASALDSNQNLFFGLNSLNEIACWDTTKRPYSRGALRTLVRDDEKLQFASGLKIKRNTEGEDELWVLTNRFQVISARLWELVKLFSLFFESSFSTRVAT